MKFPLLLALFAVVNSESQGPDKWKISDEIYRILRETFSQLGNYDDLAAGMRKSLDDALNVEEQSKEWIRGEMNKFEGHLRGVFDDAIRTVRNLASAAETAAKNIAFNMSVNTTSRPGKNYSRRWEDADGTLFHVPVEIYIGQSKVVRDSRWTGDEAVIKALKKKPPHILRSYIGTESGPTRIYPSEWDVPFEFLTVDLFDPRLRPWYTRSIAAPQDTFFLLDYSGSVMGQTMRLMQLTMMNFLRFLGPDDYINAAWYNDKFGSLWTLPKYCPNVENPGFVQATPRNKMMLMRQLMLVPPEKQAKFPPGLNYTLEEFRKFIAKSKKESWRNFGSGGHKMLVLLTDGTEEWGEEILERFMPSNPDGTRNVTVRIFSYAMGFEASGMSGIEWLSCQTNGYFRAINTMTLANSKSQSYLSVLSRSMALSLQKTTCSERPVTWTGPYMDAQGDGAVMTFSMPIVNRMEFGDNMSFIGVAGVDISISTILSFLNKELVRSGEISVFGIENNGMAVFHPNLRFPEPDLQLIRRTACYSVQHPSGIPTFEKLLFGRADERVYRQMGYLDSIFLQDILELEPNSTQLHMVRTAMIDGGCDETFFYESTQENDREGIMYTCRSFKGLQIPLSIAVGFPNRKFAIGTHLGADSEASSFLKDWNSLLVRGFIAPRIGCGNVDFGAYLSNNRFNAVAQAILAGKCKRDILQNGLNSLEAWARKMSYREDMNLTCSQAIFDDEISMAYVETWHGVTISYPKCSRVEYTSEFNQSLSSGHLLREMQGTHGEFLKLTPGKGGKDVSLRRNVIIKGLLVAVLEIELPLSNLLQKIFNGSADFANCPKCHLMTEDFLLLSRNPPQVKHLGEADGILFDQLVNSSRVKWTEEWKYQETCELEKSYFLSAGNRFGTIFNNFATTVISLLSILTRVLWWSNSGEGTTSIKFISGCEYNVKQRREEFCAIHDRKAFLNFDRPFHGRISAKCSRIKDTNLVLLISDDVCSHCKSGSCQTKEQISPKRMSDCELLKSLKDEKNYRRVARTVLSTFHEEERFAPCSRSSQKSYPLLFSFLPLITFL